MEEFRWETSRPGGITWLTRAQTWHSQVCWPCRGAEWPHWDDVCAQKMRYIRWRNHCPHEAPVRVSVGAVRTEAGAQPHSCSRKRSEFIRFYTCNLMRCALSPCLTQYVYLILLRPKCLCAELHSSKKYCPVQKTARPKQSRATCHPREKGQNRCVKCWVNLRSSPNSYTL